MAHVSVRQINTSYKPVNQIGDHIIKILGN